MATILIVEDRSIDRKLLAAVLKSDRHEVLEASDGGEALEIAALARPDLIVSDILMPSVDGYELVRRLRDAPGLADIPVIFYTATYHEREARSLAAKCGVTTILTKPSKPDTLLDTVRRVMASGVAVPRAADRTTFDRDHLHVVSTALASKVDELEAGEQRMAALVDIARDLTAQRDPSALLKKVCAATREVTFAQHALLGLLNTAGRETIALFTSGIDESLAGELKPPPIHGTPLETVITTRRAVRQVNADGRRDALGDAGAFAPQSFLAVPLATPARVHGWLALRNKLGAEQFTERDEEVAGTLATHAAIAFENVRLYEDERRHAAALEQEVVDRQRAESALREAYDRSEFALTAAGAGIWEVELQGGRVTWSKSAAALFGLPPDRTPLTIGDFFALLHPDDVDDVRRAFDTAVAERGDFQTEFRTVGADGTLHWQDVRAKVLSEGGRPVRVLGVGIDITDRKMLEQQFRQSQKMEAIGQLAGGVAHDFNNLLTAILGNANLLQDSLAGTPDASSHEISEIIKAADRAAALTRQLLAFSRKQLMQPTVLDLNDLVEDLTHMLRRLIGEDVQLTTSLASNLHSIRADASQMGQVVMNLVVNARDAMPNGGRLTIETQNVNLDVAHRTEFAEVPAGRYVMLAVSDTGTGMTDETKRRLFEPFFTTKERGKGTGLGLATVYGIVKQTGGYIWVYSEPGHGSTFKVYLPVTADAARPAAAPHHVRPSGEAKTILLVEDEDSVRQLTQLILERAGHRVYIARNAAQASAVFQQHADEVDLLITDVVMPGASGPALLRHLLQRRPGLKVLYMSGYADDAVQIQGPLDPQAAFLQKPFSAEQLVRKVHEATDG